MDISVIVVTYNQESTIGRTLDSILSQKTEAEYEIIIGDDCSTDGTEAICRGYAERYPDKIKYLRRKENLGVVGNYFDCISHSRGRYLADCAGDDFWVDNRKLQRQFEVLESRPEVSLVATRWRYYNESTAEVTREPSALPPGEYDGRELLIPVMNHTAWIHLCSALYRKEIIEKGLREHPEVFINPDFSCEDQQIILACCAAGSIVVLPDLTLYYSVGHESISHRRDYADRCKYSLRAFRQSEALSRHFGISTAALADKHARSIRHMNALAFRSGQPRLMETVRPLFQKYQIEPKLKDSLYLTLSKSRFVWKHSRKLLNKIHG